MNIQDIRNDLKKVSTVNDNLEVLNDMKVILQSIVIN